MFGGHTAFFLLLGEYRRLRSAEPQPPRRPGCYPRGVWRLLPFLMTSRVHAAIAPTAVPPNIPFIGRRIDDQKTAAPADRGDRLLQARGAWAAGRQS